jgi:hypothetical protein
MWADIFFSENTVPRTPKHLVSLCVLGKVTPHLEVVDTRVENTVCCQGFFHPRCFTGREEALDNNFVLGSQP